MYVWDFLINLSIRIKAIIETLFRLSVDTYIDSKIYDINLEIYSGSGASRLCLLCWTYLFTTFDILSFLFYLRSLSVNSFINMLWFYFCPNMLQQPSSLWTAYICLFCFWISRSIWKLTEYCCSTNCSDIYVCGNSSPCSLLQ